MPSESIRVLAIAASLRLDSCNGHLADALVIRAPADLRITVYRELAAVPLFNEDLEGDGGPQAVQHLRAAVAAADALLIVTPEYNQSMPAVAKNVVDWLSRGNPDVLSGRPAGILGATRGPWGTRLSQAALRHTLAACEALVMPTPQVYVRNAAEVFAADGTLSDERTDASVRRFLLAFQHWVVRLRR
jgi:chromate reductase